MSFESVSDEVDRIVWRKFLWSLDNLKTLRVDLLLVRQISSALQPGEAKELLPKLQELSYPESAICTTHSPYSLIPVNAGTPVTVAHF